MLPDPMISTGRPSARKYTRRVVAGLLTVIALGVALLSRSGSVPAPVHEVDSQVEARVAVGQDRPIVTPTAATAEARTAPAATGEWLVVRPIRDSGDSTVPGAALGEWTTEGIQRTSVLHDFQEGSLVVAERPRTTPKRLCIHAPGYFPLDVTAMVATGGTYDCRMAPAFDYEVELVDMNGSPALGVALEMQRAETRSIKTENNEPTNAGVWPAAGSGNRLTFRLQPGIYRHDFLDPSIAEMGSGGTVEIRGPDRVASRVVVAGIVLAVVRFNPSSPPSLSIKHYPAALAPLHAEEAVEARDSARARFGAECRILLAGTRALIDRLRSHEIPVSFDSAAGKPVEAIVSLQSLDSLAVQDVLVDRAEQGTYLEVHVRGPSGEEIRGVEIFVNRTDGDTAAVISSGDAASSIAPGEYVLRPFLPKGSLKDLKPQRATVEAGKSVVAEVQLVADLVLAEFRVQYEDGTIPAHAALQVTSGNMVDVLRSAKPEKIVGWVTKGRVDVKAMLGDRSTVDATFECETGPAKFVITFPRK